MGLLSVLTTVETDARRLRRKNVKALWIAMEQSEREVAEAVARLAKIKQEQDKEVSRLKGLVILSNDDAGPALAQCERCDGPGPGLKRGP
ncbi:Bifunctional dihydroflavonol 4-reductase/flavanone 4-reductase [Hordeum vulgare]|nr:Bifunctional dihydroflavonol 4-reductase/flavanone 4-reductase [Hordeum vulgare]